VRQRLLSPGPNVSDNPYFGDEVAAQVSRRRLMKASALGALVIGGGAAANPLTAAASTDSGPMASTAPAAGEGGGLTFKPIPPNTLDTVIVPNGYDSTVLDR